MHTKKVKKTEKGKKDGQQQETNLALKAKMLSNMRKSYYLIVLYISATFKRIKSKYVKKNE